MLFIMYQLNNAQFYHLVGFNSTSSVIVSSKKTYSVKKKKQQQKNTFCPSADDTLRM